MGSDELFPFVGPAGCINTFALEAQATETLEENTCLPSVVATSLVGITQCGKKYKEEEVHLGSQFKGTVHGGWEVTTAEP